MGSNKIDIFKSKIYNDLDWLFHHLLGTILASKFDQHASKTPHDAQFGAQDGSERRPRRPKARPRRFKNCPTAAQEVSRVLPRGAYEPGDAQEPPKSRPDPLRLRCCIVLATNMDHVG